MEQKLNIIFNGVFGSNLYELSTPTSDKDFKGVYLPSRQQLVFNDYQDSIEKQSDEVDTTLYSVTKFVKILEKCDTVSFDMIHTPRELTLTTSTLWEAIKKERSSLYCKNMRGILGYIRTQSSKYGHKVDSYEELVDFLDLLKGFDEDCKVESTPIPELVIRHKYKYIKFTPLKGEVLANIDVCGSRYQINGRVGYLISNIESKINRYGHRTKKGSLSGGDWKSLSHAYRVLIQLEEIIEKRDLVFPLVKSKDIMDIKLGHLKQETVMSMITDKYDKVSNDLDSSDLPYYPNVSDIKNLILQEIFK